jgi:hypothetical protein
VRQELTKLDQFRLIQHQNLFTAKDAEGAENRKRLHSALGYRTPEEFERAQSQNQDQSLKVATSDFDILEG